MGSVNKFIFEISDFFTIFDFTLGGNKLKVDAMGGSTNKKLILWGGQSWDDPIKNNRSIMYPPSV